MERGRTAKLSSDNTHPFPPSRIMAAAEAAATTTILELDPSHERAGRVIDDIVRLEKRIFPKHESLARSFREELKRRNSGLLYSTSGGEEEEVAGYAMYTCATSLCASITKLAGRLPEAGDRRGAVGGRRREVPEAADPARVPPRGPGEDGRRGAVPEGRLPGRNHRRGLLLAGEGCLPYVHGSPLGFIFRISGTANFAVI
ncbi:hypothetical protein BRADI_3g30047v3 [Brachypodium distachyon]|uniref:Uncharacterized protein n=1 Tax=Brachypodium distachyon TaxID=15368 RepID=A0A0Q3FGS2_BRADI|nr:hypothetical protein BRADI_3g30047v3 [Brachypodium distachyon]